MLSTIRSLMEINKDTVCISFLCIFLTAALFTARAEPPESDNNQDGTAPSYAYNRIKLVFEPDAYYTDLDLIISLTKAPSLNSEK